MIFIKLGNDYDLLVLPGGVKALEKLGKINNLLNLYLIFIKLEKSLHCICSGVQLG